MFPFIKKPDAGALTIESVRPKHLEEDEETSHDGIATAVAHDFLMAVETKDINRMRSAVTALIEYLKEEDEIQDELTFRR